MTEPYRLHHHRGHVLVTGEGKELTAAEAIRGARRFGGPRASVAFPATRLAIFAAEAISVAETTPEYNAARAELVRPSQDDVDRVNRVAELRGVDLSGLLQHQRDWLAFSLRRRGLFNASEQGLGKTRMALTVLALWAPSRTLVAVPQPLGGEWAAELAQAFPNGLGRNSLPISLYDLTVGAVEEREALVHWLAVRSAPGPTIAVVNYEVLDNLRAELRRFNPECIIADESWRIKEANSRASRVLCDLGRRMRVNHQYSRALALCGTPVGNHPGNLWSQVNFVGWPGVGMTHSQFLRRYSTFEQVRAGQRTIQKPVGLRDPVGLMEQLEPLWYRATKATCLQLPPKIWRTVRLPLTDAQRSLYEDVRQRGDAALGNELSLAGGAVKQLRQAQICGGNIVRWEGGEGEPEDVTARTRGWRVEPLHCPKMDWLRLWANEVLRPHPTTRCIVWCRFNAEVERIADDLTEVLGERVAIAWGPTPSSLLDTIKTEFNNRQSGVQVIVAQIKKLFNGHNLQAADWMIYFSPTYSYIEQAQSEDRAHRLGRVEAVNYIRLVAERSVDEQAWAALERKEDVATRVTPHTVG